jgi:RNA polymerase sigma-70 factor (ECF subfamily)
MSEEIIKVQIAKVLAGETKAYTYLVEQYKDYVFTIAMTILKNREDAEDVSQDIFIKAFKQLHTFKGDSKFSTWLYTVAFRTAISANRKLKLSLKPIDDYIENTMHADDLTNQLKVLETADQKYYLDKALKLIPE